MSARLGLAPADRRPTAARKCQQLDISGPTTDFVPGHPDRPLSFRWEADYETLSRILELPRCKSKRGERALASIVYDAALAARENPGRRISYSRRKNFYAAADRYYGTDYGYDTVVPAVDALVAAGLLVEHDKVKGRPVVKRGPHETGTQSSFLPAPHIADIVLPKPERRPCELIRLKDAAGNLIGYRDTERTMRDRRFLEAVNRNIAEADIRLHGINGAIIDEVAGTIFFPGFLQWLDEGDGDHTVYTRMIELYRVYNGGWTLGGRFYGGWWQQVRARDRRHLLIDGGETIELDYEMLHPRLLYAAVGRRPEGDAYTLDGWDRKVCKRAFNILLNAPSYPSALGAIMPHVGGSRRAAAQLIADMKRRHSAIADRFHSGIGIRLQHTDSEMAKAVLQELTVRQGITVLPIHDSFIVRKEHRAALQEAMDRAFSTVTETVGIPDDTSETYGEIYPQREARSRGAGGIGVPDVSHDAERSFSESNRAETSPDEQEAPGMYHGPLPLRAPMVTSRGSALVDQAVEDDGPGRPDRSTDGSMPTPQRETKGAHQRDRRFRSRDYLTSVASGDRRPAEPNVKDADALGNVSQARPDRASVALDDTRWGEEAEDDDTAEIEAHAAWLATHESDRPCDPQEPDEEWFEERRQAA